MNSDFYTNILYGEQKLTIILIIVFSVIFAVGIVSLIYWKLNIKKKMNNPKENKKKDKEGKNEIATWALALLATIPILSMAIISQAVELHKISSDINNQSFITYSDGVTIKTEIDWHYRKADETEYHIYLQNETENLKFILSETEAKKYNLTSGEHSNLTIVYSEKSKIILDIYETNE